MAKRRLDQLDVAGKRVLVRVDFNVPFDQDIEGIALYDQRLRATLPTIQYLIDQGSKIVLCSHLGRPNGEVVEGLRHAPVGDRDDIVVERARLDGGGVLLDEDRPFGGEAVQAGDRATGLQILPRREGSAGAAIDEHFHARRSVIGAEAHVIGRTPCHQRRDPPLKLMGLGG